ncbi:MAG TPA: response regulator [Acidimicrobiales bacterium]|nr:response regulator [Acidimicrobiales bacterium]
MTRPTALVCEDDATTRGTLAVLLANAGYDVVAETALASEAVQLAGAHKPSVVILDLRLLGMSGRELLPHLLEAAPRTSVIVYTSDDQARQSGELARAVAVVDKAHPESLTAVLDRLAGHARPTSSWNTGSVADILTRLLEET